MSSTDDIELNFSKISKYVTECVNSGADLVCLPENFAFIGATKTDATEISEDI